MGHEAVVFGNITPEFFRITGIRSWPDKLKTVKSRRMYLVQVVRAKRKHDRSFELQRLQGLERLLGLERLERLEQLEQLEQLELSNKDYRDVEIRDHSIVYCDPPYAGTAGYKNKKNDFDSQVFGDWAADSPHPTFISEYSSPSPRLRLFADIPKRNLMSGSGGKAGMEKLFMNAAALNLIRSKGRGQING
jgi:site-specific DNA-adenine methylase